MTFWIESMFYYILKHNRIFRKIATLLGAISNFTFLACPLFVKYYVLLHTDCLRVAGSCSQYNSTDK